ncbi:BAF_collapsed_G0030690.mRNA.1.CDS.1 [Saccharomyces cerevisiae]|nr:BAF_collapsed_G0030690.mRNA.1.CDS.1 [Saccharomyces cerevisiae]
MKASQICSYLLSIAPLVVSHGVHHNRDHGHEANHESKQICFLQNHLFVLGPRYNAIVAILIIQLMPCLFVLLVPGLRKNDRASLTLSLLVSLFSRNTPG